MGCHDGLEFVLQIVHICVEEAVVAWQLVLVAVHLCLPTVQPSVSESRCKPFACGAQCRCLLDNSWLDIFYMTMRVNCLVTIKFLYFVI